MAWFKRKAPTASIKETKLKEPDGLWVKCDACKEIIYRQELERNAQVCPKCDHHFRIDSKTRLLLLADLD